MKRTVLLSAISLLVAATSCVKEEVIKENPVPGEGQGAVVAPTLSIESENTLFTASDEQNATLAFKSLGGEALIYVNTNVSDWEVKAEGDEIATLKADKVAGTLAISAKKNTATKQLAATYTIKAGDLTATIRATQNAYGTPEIVASENNFHFAAVGRTSASFTVESSIDNWNFETEGIEWLLVKKEGNTIILEAYDNANTEDREATFVLYAGEGSEKVTETIAVAQDRKVNAATSALVVPMEPFPSDTAHVQVASNYDWNYEVVEGESDWFEIKRAEDQLKNGYNYGELTFVGKDNRNSETRKAVVRITTGDGEQNVKTIDIVVSQAGIDIKAFMMAITIKPNAYGNVNYEAVLPIKGATDVKVDWGDGTVEELGDVTTDPKHTYTDQNRYVVSIWGNVPRLSYGDYYGTAYTDMVEKIYNWGELGFVELDGGFKNCKALVAVPTDDRGAFAEVTDMCEMFSQSGLQAIPEGFLKYAEKLLWVDNMFYSCKDIKEIPADFFYNCPVLNSVCDAFGGTGITHVDKDLFSKNPVLDDASQVFSQTPLEEVPAGLFDHNPEITTFNAVFSYCRQLKKIPAGLFANQTKVTTFRMAFNDTAIEEIPENLFGENYENTNFQSTFSHANIKSIPEHLFKGFNKVETFSSCFNGCALLESIPADLFTESGALTAFPTKASNKSSCLNMVFENCASLKEIPAGLFDGFQAVTGLSSVFEGCSSLESIPAGLFKDFVNVTSFATMFKGCASLKTLPSGLFNGLVKVTSFSGLFQDCTGLESIPANLLAGCEKVTNISKMFYGCTSLKTVDADAFVDGVAVTNIQSLFEGCTSLESVPGNVFAGLVKATSTTRIFYNSGLKTVPSGLLKPLTATASFDQVFAECKALETVEADVFPGGAKAKTLTKVFFNDTALKNVGLMFGEANTAASGTIANIFDGCTALETVPAGIFDNLKAVTTVTAAFQNSGIKTLPDGLFAKMEKATTFGTCFKNCDEMVEAPHNLFGSSATASTITNMFENCDKLTTIPADLMGTPTKGNLNVGSMFKDCKALEAVPAGLFKGCKAKTYTMIFAGCSSLKTVGSEAIDCYGQNATVSNMFLDCTSLETVPADFMINVEAVTNLYCMFKNSGIKSLPVNLFDKYVKLNDIRNLFENCTNLTGESPYTIVNGVKYHLYERTTTASEVNGLAAITKYALAFKGCTGLSDYSQIDGTWK